MGSENVGLIIMKTDGGGGGEDSPTYRKSDRTGKISRGSSLQLTGSLSPSDWDWSRQAGESTLPP